MMTSYEMQQRWFEKQPKEYQEEHAEDCPICGYKMKKEKEYLSNNGQVVNIMFCESCNYVEPWIIEPAI